MKRTTLPVAEPITNHQLKEMILNYLNSRADYATRLVRFNKTVADYGFTYAARWGYEELFISEIMTTQLKHLIGHFLLVETTEGLQFIESMLEIIDRLTADWTEDLARINPIVRSTNTLDQEQTFANITAHKNTLQIMKEIRTMVTAR